MDKIMFIKMVSALLYPLALVFILSILAWLTSRSSLARAFKFSSVVLLIIASNPMVAKWLVQSLEEQYPQQAINEIEKHDAILVLGGGLRLPIAPAINTQIGSGSDRYWHAAQLYRAGKAKQIILSGGNVYAQKGIKGEAFYAARLLSEWGVPKSSIVIETASRTTQENMLRSAEFLRSKEISSVLLVTSAYHMPRALRSFRRLPVKVSPSSADILIRNQSAPAVFNWIPSASALSLTTTAVHEYYGSWFLELKAFISSR